MANEQVNLEWVIKVVNDTKKGIDEAVADFKKLTATLQSTGQASAKIGDSQQQQRLSGLHTRISQLTSAFRKLGIELETIDLYFLSGLKVVTLFKLLDFTKKAVLSAEEYANTLRGIAGIARSTGQNVEKVFGAINTLASDGLVSVQDLAEAMRNLLKIYNLQDAVKMIQALKTTGIGLGTQHGMPLGEAIKRVTEGIKNWNSVLADATGVTENLDAMVKRYAGTLGVSAEKLSQAQKYQAVLNAFMKEASIVSDAEKLALDGLTGSIAKLNKAWTDFKNHVGSGWGETASYILKLVTLQIEATNLAISLLEKLADKIVGLIPKINQYLLAPITLFQGLIDAYTGKAKNATDSLKENLELAEEFKKQMDNLAPKGVQVEISANFKSMPPPNIPPAGPTQEMIDWPENMAKLIDNAYKAFDTGMRQMEEAARKWGEKVANAFSQPLERGISDVFFGLFTGERTDFLDIARSFGRSLARAISDAFAEALMTPFRAWFSGILSGVFSGFGASMGGATRGGNVGFASTNIGIQPQTIAINIGTGLTPREIGAIVETEVSAAYERNSKIRKIIKAQR
jgi:hypothetical protein